MNTKNQPISVLRVIFVVMISLNVIFFATFLIFKFSYVKYPYIDMASYKTFFLLAFLSLTPTFISFIGLIIQSASCVTKRRNIYEVSLTLLSLCSIIASLYGMFLLNFYTPLASKTENPKNYLIVDESFNREYLEIFPQTIPSMAIEVKYYYCYWNTWGSDLDIIAQWKLPKSKYESEKRRIKNEYLIVEVAQNSRQKDFIDYRIIYLFDEGYNCKFFSFSDNTMTVRYTVSHSTNSNKGKIKPYFMESDEW